MAREAEASVVYQDEIVTGFMDHVPVTPGHLLVIPNSHAPDLSKVSVEEARQVFAVAKDLAQALRVADFQCEGVSFYLADGKAAGQAVFHTHLHVIPRFRGDSCGLHLHAGPARRAGRAQLEENATKLRAALEGAS